MNPHDPRERPGAHRVAEMFGVGDPWELADNHPVGSSLDLIGRTVAESARDVDELHSALAEAARPAIEALTPIARGDYAGVGEQGSPLHTTGPEIALLFARRASASVQLTRVLSSYQRLQLRSDANPLSVVRSHADKPPTEQPRVRNDDWALSGDRQRRALEAVEAGGLRFHRSSIWPDDIWLSDGRGRRPQPEVWPETIRRLVTDGLLDQDTSEELYRPGQLLSLTAEGETALREARSAAPRVSAALHRSRSAPVPGGLSDAPSAPAGPAAKPSRTR